MKSSRFLTSVLVAGLLSMAVWSCRIDNAPTGLVASSAAATPEASANLVGDLLRGVGLLRCTPLPYASASRLIGPTGGELRIGPHVLQIPAGVLSQPVLIRGDAPSDTVNSVRLYPEGLRFSRSASLTMSYRNCNLMGRLAPKRIAYTTERLQILSFLLSLDNLLLQQVTGRLDHFSRYAVAW
ncbi:MAG: hypothetical protein ACREMF_00340 [Gemmatimonadales bacterium]